MVAVGVAVSIGIGVSVGKVELNGTHAPMSNVIARRVEMRGIEIPTKQSPRTLQDCFLALAHRNDSLNKVL